MAILYLVGQTQSQSFRLNGILRLKKQAVSFDFLTKKCYVLDPDGIFGLAGLDTKYTNKHEPPSRVAAPDELEILYYRRGDDGHFVAARDGRVIYDPLGRSNAVESGALKSKRIFKLV